MRKLLLIPLLTATLAQAEDFNILYLNGTSVTFDVINYISQDFDTAHFSDDWKSGNRYEINVVKHFNEGRIQPSGGTYFFYEQRDWEGGTFSGIKETGDYYCWGFGLQGGSTIHIIPPDQNLGLALVPYARAGLGFQDLDLKEVMIDGSRYNISGGSGRIEVAAGLDLRLTINKQIELVVGGGVDYWTSADVAFYAGSGGNGAFVGSNGNFTGTDVWVRIGAGVHF